MKVMPLTDTAWALIVQAAGTVQGKAFWMNRLTWVRVMKERGVPQRHRLYSVAVCIDDTTPDGQITLERRGPTW